MAVFFSFIIFVLGVILTLLFIAWQVVVFGSIVEKNNRTQIQKEIAEFWKPDHNPATLIDYILPASAIPAYIALKLLYTPIGKKKAV